MYEILANNQEGPIMESPWPKIKSVGWSSVLALTNEINNFWNLTSGQLSTMLKCSGLDWPTRFWGVFVSMKRASLCMVSNILQVFPLHTHTEGNVVVTEYGMQVGLTKFQRLHLVLLLCMPVHAWFAEIKNYLKKKMWCLSVKTSYRAFKHDLQGLEPMSSYSLHLW